MNLLKVLVCLGDKVWAWLFRKYLYKDWIEDGLDHVQKVFELRIPNSFSIKMRRNFM